MDFETFCEHEYGYAQEELRVLYKGTYYLRNDMFFRPDSTHVYDLGWFGFMQRGRRRGC